MTPGALRVLLARIPASGRNEAALLWAVRMRTGGTWDRDTFEDGLTALAASGDAHERDGVWYPGPAAGGSAAAGHNRGQSAPPPSLEDLEQGSPPALEVVTVGDPGPSEPESGAPSGPSSSEAAAAPPPPHPPGDPTPPEVGAGTPSRGEPMTSQPDPRSLTQRVRADLAAHPMAAAAEVGARIGIGGNGAAKVLSTLKATGRAVRTGTEGQYRYSIAEPGRDVRVTSADAGWQKALDQQARAESAEAELGAIRAALGYAADPTVDLLAATRVLVFAANESIAQVSTLEEELRMRRAALVYDEPPEIGPCPADHVDVYVELEDVALPGTTRQIEAYVIDEETEADAGNVVLLVRVPRSRPRRPVLDVRR